MSAVELAVKKVKKLSPRLARELLGWLDARSVNSSAAGQLSQNSRSNALARRQKEFKKWHESVRGTTNWEPPRMPDDLVKRIRL